MNEKDFFNYCWSFYGPNELYGKDFFNNNLTKKELQTAITIRSKILGKFKNNEYKFISLDYDSLDREIVRDIIFKLREPNKETEFFVND